MIGTDVNRLYAMKIMEKSIILKKPHIIHALKNELRILEELASSPTDFVVKIHYAFQVNFSLESDTPLTFPLLK